MNLLDNNDIDNTKQLKFQIFDSVQNIFKNYIVKKRIDVDGFIKIYGNYMGSSTRIGKIGTFYIKNSETWIPLHIRVLDENDDVLVNRQLTQIDLEGMKDHSDNIIGYNIDNIVIMTRSLHRYEGYPYEISGINIRL